MQKSKLIVQYQLFITQDIIYIMFIVLRRNLYSFAFRNEKKRFIMLFLTRPPPHVTPYTFLSQPIANMHIEIIRTNSTGLEGQFNYLTIHWKKVKCTLIQGESKVTELSFVQEVIRVLTLQKNANRKNLTSNLLALVCNFKS